MDSATKNSDLPEGWVRTTLDMLGEIYCGQSPSVSEVNTNELGVPYVTGPEQWDGHRIERTKWTEHPRRIAPAGSIFITVKGAGIGKLFPGIHAAIGRDIYAFKPFEDLNPDFVFYALRHTIDEVVLNGKGDIPGLSKSHILDHTIGLPGTSEQDRIVAKIEELFSKLDNGIENLEMARQQLTIYRQALLKQALEGKFTARWREEHQKQDSWHDTTLGEVAKWGSGGTPSRKHPEYYNGNILFLKTGELGPQYVHDTHERITKEAIDNSSAKLFPKGSVGIAMYGATIGKTSIFGKDMATNQACAVAQPDERLKVLYLYYFLVSQKPEFVNLGKGGAQPNISQGILKAYPFSLPSEEEQTRIIDILEGHLSVIDQALSDIDEQLSKSEILRQSIISAAFSGKLVEQDANEEPASVLLDRILAEQSSRTNNK